MALHDKALLVTLTIGMPPQSKSLKGESELLEIKHQTEPSQTQVVNKLFAKSDIKPLQQAANKARIWFKEKTLPYGRSMGLIPTSRYYDFLQELGTYRLEFNEQKQALIDNIEDVLHRAQVANGSLFNRNNYPSLAELQDKIYFAFEVHPVPSSNDYDKLADLTPEQIETLKQEAVINSRTKTKSAIEDLFKRLVGGLEHAANRLQDDDNGHKKIFHDTLVSNIHKAVEAAETLNIEDDEQLKDMTEKVKSIFEGLTADDLRRDTKLRKETADRAAELANKMSEIF